MFRVDTYKKTGFQGYGSDLRNVEYKNLDKKIGGLRMLLAHPQEVCEDIRDRYAGYITDFEHANIFWSDDIMNGEEFISASIPEYLYALHIDLDTTYFIIVSRFNNAKTALLPTKLVTKQQVDAKKVLPTKLVTKQPTQLITKTKQNKLVSKQQASTKKKHLKDVDEYKTPLKDFDEYKTPVKDFDDKTPLKKDSSAKNTPLKWVSTGNKVTIMKDTNGKMLKVSRTVYNCSCKPGENRISRVGVDGKREYVKF